MKPAVATHVYADDSTRDHRGEGRCATCLLPRGNQVHELPDTSEANELDARRIGEREVEFDD